jgi:hypothetical protein
MQIALTIEADNWTGEIRAALEWQGDVNAIYV